MSSSFRVNLSNLLPEPPIYDQTNYLPIPEEFAKYKWDDHNDDEDSMENDNVEEPIKSSFQTLSSIINLNIPTSSLYDHQKEALQKLKEHVDNFHVRDGLPDVHLIVLPTGTGKRSIIALAPYVLEAESVLVVTPSILITKQFSLDFAKDLDNILVKRKVLSIEEFKIIQQRLPNAYVVENAMDLPRTFDQQHELIIVNTQKLALGIESLPKGFDVVIIDEAHHYPADTWQQIVDHFVYSKKIFLTASSKRREGDILGIHQQKLTCYEMTRSSAIEKGIICATDPVEATVVLHESFTQQANYYNLIGHHNEELITEIQPEDDEVQTDNE